MAAGVFLRNHWPTITITATAAAIASAAVVMLSNMPPHRIVMATGPQGSAYYEDGKRYRAVLAKAGVDVQLVPTAGSVETAALLRDPHSGVSVGLIQGGVIGAANASGLESLGTLAYEPLWWFRRREVQGVGADGLRGRRIAIGSEGSGTRVLSLELIKRPGFFSIKHPTRDSASKPMPSLINSPKRWNSSGSRSSSAGLPWPH